MARGLTGYLRVPREHRLRHNCRAPKRARSLPMSRLYVRGLRKPDPENSTPGGQKSVTGDGSAARL